MGRTLTMTLTLVSLLLLPNVKRCSLLLKCDSRRCRQWSGCGNERDQSCWIRLLQDITRWSWHHCFSCRRYGLFSSITEPFTINYFVVVITSAFLATVSDFNFIIEGTSFVRMYFVADHDLKCSSEFYHLPLSEEDRGQQQMSDRDRKCTKQKQMQETESQSDFVCWCAVKYLLLFSIHIVFNYETCCSY